MFNSSAHSIIIVQNNKQNQFNPQTTQSNLGLNTHWTTQTQLGHLTQTRLGHFIRTTNQQELTKET